MQIPNMYKPVRPRRNSLPSSNVHRSKSKVSSKTDYNVPKNAKGFHDSLRTKSKTPTFVERTELHTKNSRNFMSHSLSDGDENLDSKTSFVKGAKLNHVIKYKRPQFSSSQPIDTPNRRLQETPLHHSPPSNESPQRYGSHKKFKEDNNIKQFVADKYALLKQLISFDESNNGDNFYAGAKFNNSPSPGDLPLPPMQWLNSCQAQAKTIQNSPLLFNITM